MKILLVNDDGIEAPGLKALAEALAPHGEVFIVAPSAERSGAGLSITLYDPLHVRPVAWEGATAYSVSGTPGDCIRLACGNLLSEPPDLVFSGINKGTNAGRNVFYSGTVGGAIEACLWGIPAVALSCYSSKNPNYATATRYVESLLAFLSEVSLPAGTLLNVNMPPHEEPRGLRLARQGLSFWQEKRSRHPHPQGWEYRGLEDAQLDFDEHPESDIALLQDGYVAAVPVQINELTCHDTFEQHRHRLQ